LSTLFSLRIARFFGWNNAVFAPLEGFSFAMLLFFDLHFGFALR